MKIITLAPMRLWPQAPTLSVMTIPSSVWLFNAATVADLAESDVECRQMDVPVRTPILSPSICLQT